MNIKRNCIVTMVLLLAISMSAGCGQQPQAEGLKIYSMTTALGAADLDDPDRQKLSYTVYLTNEQQEEVYVRSVTPLLGEAFGQRVLLPELEVLIGQAIPAQESMEIEGEIIFAADGMSKEEILGIGPFITAFQVISEETIALPPPMQELR